MVERYLAADASRLGWLGANLDDGSAFMAFRMRTKDGPRSGHRRRCASAANPCALARRRPGGVHAKRTWRSPRTGIEYPIAMEVRVGSRRWNVEPLLDDQELDARSQHGHPLLGRRSARERQDGRWPGYLELTGYGERVPF
jgi:predicted secreted hydrolase